MSVDADHSTVQLGAINKLHVPAQDIQSELEKIRVAAAELDAKREAAETGAAAPRLKVTLSNLVIFPMPGLSAIEVIPIDDLITELCIKYPSRFFIINLDHAHSEAIADEAQPVNAAVSSRCVFANSGSHVCSEEIYLHVNSTTVSYLPNLLLSLLVPDVPVILVILGDLSELPGTLACKFAEVAEKLRVGLKELSDIVVVDSLLFADGGRSIAALSGELNHQEEAVSRHSQVLRLFGSAKVRDLNWVRLKRWRELIAEGFEADIFTDPSSRLNYIKVELSSGNNELSFESALLIGWLCAALNWSLENVASAPTGEFTLNCHDGQGQHQIKFSSKSSTTGETKISQVKNSSICSLEFFASNNLKQGILKLSILGMQGLAELSIGTSMNSSKNESACDFVARYVPFALKTVDDLLLDCIEENKLDPLFVKAVENAIMFTHLLSIARLSR